MLHRPGGTPGGNSVKAKTLSDFIFASTWTILHLVFKLPKLVEPVLREDMMVDICWGESDGGREPKIEDTTLILSPTHQVNTAFILFCIRNVL